MCGEKDVTVYFYKWLYISPSYMFSWSLFPALIASFLSAVVEPNLAMGGVSVRLIRPFVTRWHWLKNNDGEVFIIGYPREHPERQFETRQG